MPEHRDDELPHGGRRMPDGRVSFNDGEAAIEALLGALGIGPDTDFEELLGRHHPSDEDRQLSKWPILPHTVDGKTPDDETKAEIAREIEASRAAVVRDVRRPREESKIPLEQDPSFKALFDILLKNASSPEQVTRLTRGYITTQVQRVMSKIMEVGMSGPDGRVVTMQGIEDEVVRQNPARWDTLALARIPEWIAFRYGLETRAFETYGLEPGHDSVFTLLADPTAVYMLGFDPETEEEATPKVERKIPESKRMTPEKLARFFQFPGLQRLIEIDAYHRDPATLGTNLGVLAEYFCENDDVLTKNKVTPEDVQKWLEAKFLENKPSKEVAWYVWGKLQGTTFERASTFIEQYILDDHAKNDPWLFELGLKNREQCRGTGSIFELYAFAIASFEYSMNPADKLRKPDFCKLLPSIYLLQRVLASQIYGGDRHVQALLAYYDEKSADFVPEYNGLENLDLAKDSLEPLRLALDLEDQPPHEWTNIPGFELLDPMEIYKAGTINKLVAMGNLAGPVLDKILKTEDATILRRFKKEVMDKLHPVKQKVLKQVIEEAAMPLAAKAIFAESSTDEVVEVARGQTKPDLSRRIILPGDVAWDELVGTHFDAARLTGAAELEVVRRQLKGARGAEAITGYLMSHVDTMRPSEVVRPNAEAPHDRIVREFGESPDLLSLLDMATLLTYFGYDSDQVFAEISDQANISDAAARPELASIGIESELAANTPEGRIINSDKFAWIFNVLARDLKDRMVNEVMTAPTTGPFMQAMFFQMMIDKRFGLINPDELWRQSEIPGRSPSSLHLNVSIPTGLPFTPDLIHRYMEELQRIQWLVHGGSSKQHRVAHGRVSNWRKRSLLDVTGAVDKNTKVEIRNLALEQDGSHIDQMRELQLLASACIQMMKEQGGKKLSPSGHVMAEIYRRFQIESRGVTEHTPGFEAAARGLLQRYSDEIATELKLAPTKKETGIITL